jgi:hypothetical protein
MSARYGWRYLWVISVETWVVEVARLSYGWRKRCASRKLFATEKDYVMKKYLYSAIAMSLLAGCSGNMAAMPSAASAAAGAAGLTAFHSASPNISTSFQGRRMTTSPNEVVGCKSTDPNVYWHDGWWQVGIGGTEWQEQVGYWRETEITPQTWEFEPCNVIAKQQCNSTTEFNCPPIIRLGPTGVIGNSLFVASSRCGSCFAVAETTSNSNNISVVRASGKTMAVDETLNLENAYPRALAVAKNGTVYASGVDDSDAPTGVFYFLPGSTTPSGVLSDPNLGPNPGSVAVDVKNDVFFAYTTSAGSQTTLNVDEFRAGKGAAVNFARIPGGIGGTIAVAEKGEVVASVVNGGSAAGGQIYVLSAKGQMLGSFATTTNPDSISLDSSNLHLFSVDSQNDRVSEFSFPSGTLIRSAEVVDSKGNAGIPESFDPANSKE